MLLNHKWQLAFTSLLRAAAGFRSHREIAHGAVSRQLLIDCFGRRNLLCFLTGHNLRDSCFLLKAASLPHSTPPLSTHLAVTFRENDALYPFTRPGNHQFTRDTLWPER